MTTIKFFTETRKLFQNRVWHWLIIALKEDPIIWNELTIEDSVLFEMAFKKLPSQIERWSPASLGLLLIDPSIQIDNLIKTPIESIEDALLKRAIVTYDNWKTNPNKVERLDEACLIALSLREMFRVKGEWTGFEKAIGGHFVELKTTIVCLFGMIPQPIDFLSYLLSVDSNVSFNTVLHAIFSTPHIQEDQIELLKELIENSPVDLWLDILNEIEKKRTWLVPPIAKWMIEAEKDEKLFTESNQAKIKVYEHLIDLSKIAILMNKISIFRKANKLREVKELAESSLKETRKIEGYFFNEIASVISQSIENDEFADGEKSLELWKKAAQLNPNEPEYVVGIAESLFNLGRLEDAQAYLSVQDTDQVMAENIELMIINALVLSRLTDFTASRQILHQVVSKFRTGEQFLSANRFVQLINLCLEMKETDIAYQVAKIGCTQHPHDLRLLVLFSKISLTKEDFLIAVNEAYFAKAISLVGNRKNSDGLDGLDEKAVQRLLIETLEKSGEWGAALDEYIFLIEQQSQPRIKDLHALSSCAIHANKPEQAIHFCREALSKDNVDGISYGLLGKALLQLNDLDGATENLVHATHLAATEPLFWIDLAEVYLQMGNYGKFFETLKTANHTNPESAEIQYKLGEAFLKQNAPTQALTSLRRAFLLIKSEVKEKLTQTEILYDDDLVGFKDCISLFLRIAVLLGNALKKLGFLEEARQVLEEVYNWKSSDNATIIKKNKEFAELAIIYGQTLIALEQPSAALDILEFYTRIKPNDESAKLLLAKTIIDLNDSNLMVARALPLLSELINSPSLFPHSAGGEEDNELLIATLEAAETVAYFAEVLKDTGDYTRAKKYYKYALESELREMYEWKIRLSMGLGQVAIKLHEPEVAIAVLSGIMHDSPDNIRLRQLLANAYLAAGLVEDSYHTAENVITIKPSDPSLLVWLANHCLKLHKINNTQNGFYLKKAVSTLEKAISIWPNRYDLIIELAELEVKIGENEKALQLLNSIINANGNIEKMSLQDLERLASILRDMGENNLAIYILERAIDESNKAGGDTINDSDGRKSGIHKVNLLKKLAEIQKEQGYQAAALESIEKGLTISPRDINLYLEKGKLLSSMKEDEAALEWLQDALAIFPAHPDLHKLSADLYYKKGDLFNAINHIEFSLNTLKNTRDSKSFLMLSLFASQLARGMLLPEKAISYLDGLSIDEQPDEIQSIYYSYKAELYMDLGEWKKAHNILQILDQIDAQNSYVLSLKSRLLYKEEKYQKSRKFYFKALEKLEGLFETNNTKQKGFSELNDLVILRSIGENSLIIGEWRKAVNLLFSVLELSPGELLSNFDFIKAYVSAKEARAIYTEFDIVTHSQKSIELNENKKKLVAQAFKKLENSLLQISNQNEEEMNIQPLSQGFRDLLTWKARWKALDDPSEDSLQLIETLFKQDNLISVELLSSYIRLLRENETIDKLNEIVDNNILISKKDSLLDAQLALSFEAVDIEKALDYIINARMDDSETTDRFVKPQMLDYLLARLAYEDGAYATALQAIQTALKEWHDEPRWNALAAAIHQVNDETIGLPSYKDAIYYLQKAIDVEPTTATYKIGLAELLIRVNQIDKAKKLLEELIQLDGNNPQVWMLLADVQRRSGKFDEATTSAAFALDRSSDPIPPLSLRAKIELQAGNYAGAEEIARTLIKIKPNHFEAIQLLVEALKKQNNYDEAIDVLESSIPLFEDNSQIQIEHIQLLKESRGVDVAFPVLRNLVQQNPANLKYQVLLSSYLLDIGKIQDAENNAKSLLNNHRDKLSDEDLSCLYSVLATKLIATGQLDQAVHQLTKAIKHNPENLSVYLKLARVFEDRREFNKALDVYEAVVTHFPNDYHAYYQAGFLLKEMKDYAGAEKMLQRAAHLAPQDEAIRNLLNAIEAINIVKNKSYLGS